MYTNNLIMGPKLYIFDLDGTLVNTVKDLNRGINYALNKNGYPSKSVAHTSKAIGNGIFKTFLRSLPIEDLEAAKQCLIDFRDYYSKHYLDYSYRYKGMLTTLRILKKEGHLLAVATNKLDKIAINLVNTLYPNIFDMILGDDGISPIKPDPSMINKIINTLKINKTDAVYIGDSEVDILSASNAEIKLILVDYGFHRNEDFLTNKAGMHISKPSELLNINL